MRIAFLGLFLTASSTAPAQFYIGAGAEVQLTGNVEVTLSDADLVNHGTLIPGNSTVYLAGLANTIIGGTVPVQFHILHINKSAGRSVIFLQPVRVSNAVQLEQGLADLNGHDLDLGNTGQLLGESANSRIVGTTGGEILFAAVLNAPAGANPGNLGASISSSQNLGNVSVRRGHRELTIPGAQSILRYYTITPANNSGLAATLRFRYFDEELAAQPENELVLWRSPDASTWTNQRFDVRDAAQNYIEKTGIDAFSTWTIAAPAASLPVTFAGLHLACDRGNVTLQWKTTQESNSSHFVIERNNGMGWFNIGQLPAAGNSSTEKSYVFTDDKPMGKDHYRIAQYDLDGRVKYTGLLVAACTAPEALRAWPNPFVQAFMLSIQSSESTTAILRVTNSAGLTIMNKQLNLQRGLNQFHLDLQQAAAGVYQLQVIGTAGRQETINLMKQ